MRIAWEADRAPRGILASTASSIQDGFSRFQMPSRNGALLATLAYCNRFEPAPLQSCRMLDFAMGLFTAMVFAEFASMPFDCSTVSGVIGAATN